jgi:2-iminobutanoate/2-iminopropanoate deaminase
MNWISSAISSLMLLSLAGCSSEPERTHFPASRLPPAATAIASGPTAAFSAAVLVGNTLYVSGGIDVDATTGKLGGNAEESAKFALEGLKKSVERAGMSMDDLVWVQVFCSDLSYYTTFNTVYKTYFHGDLPARAFLGVDHLLANAHFEVMGIAVRKAASSRIVHRG